MGGVEGGYEYDMVRGEYGLIWQIDRMCDLRVCHYVTNYPRHGSFHDPKKQCHKRDSDGRSPVVIPCEVVGEQGGGLNHAQG